MLERYKTIYRGGEGEMIEKKSRFIATVRMVENEQEALDFIEEMRKKYWNATHNCFAYVIGENRETIRCSDDGEPGGTAGKPMLDVLLGEGMYNTAVVVTRYFGGTLLGTGGLVRAYSKAVQEGLSQSDVIEKQYGAIIEIGTDYNGVGKIQYLIGERKIPTLNSEYTDKVKIQVILPISDVDKFCADLTESTNGRAKIEITDKLLAADRYIAVANYYAAEALLARVLLAEGNYADAKEAAQNVIDSEKFRLVDAEAAFNVPTESLDLLLNDEQIFALRNKAIFDYSENLHLGKSENGVTSGAALPLTSDIGGIYDAINDDIRLANWIQAGNNYMVKYVKEVKKFYPKQVLIKLSEMYLIVAESQMRTNDPNALETLNVMRRSRITNANLSDKDVITEDELIEEMRREFLGEGQMFFQYKRLNTSIRNILKEVPANNTIFVLPIPEGEIEYGKY